MVSTYRVGTPVIVTETEHGHTASYAARVEQVFPEHAFYIVADKHWHMRGAHAENVRPRNVIGDRATAHKPVNRRAQYYGFYYIGLEMERWSERLGEYHVAAYTSKRASGRRNLNVRCRCTRYYEDKIAQRDAEWQHQADMEIYYNVQ